MMIRNFMLLFSLIFCSLSYSNSAHANMPVAEDAGSDSVTVKFEYTEKGWEFASSDGRYKLQFQSRLQFRWSEPFDSNPVTYDDFDKGDRSSFKVNRARLKIGGNAYQPWLKYYWEYELMAGNLLDFRVMVTKYKNIQLKAGQWKAQYNRERIISSGKQQTADRSILTRPFTIDRQQGVSLYGHVSDWDVLDFNYWVSVFSGSGRGVEENDDTYLMYMSRLQWNIFRESVPFYGSDLNRHEDAVAIVALGGVTNRSQYTRFSQAGGGSLEGFPIGDPGQYRVNQWVLESALMWQGFSWQQELHWKEINDKVNNSITTLMGNYIQFGYFFHNLVSDIPEPLEFAFRHAIYYPDVSFTDNSHQEWAFDLNWFFNGHNNKLTLEFTHFVARESNQKRGDANRFRLQWDISF